jgi:CheY-like chemotaxis protein
MAKTIFVVEDDIDYQFQLRTQLEAAGYSVVVADSAADARQRFDAQPPDLAVVDLMLEHIDSGFVLCYHMKKRSPRMPVIMITGVAGEADMEFSAQTPEERMWLKADVVLDKPVRFETLQREIARLLDPT